MKADTNQFPELDKTKFEQRGIIVASNNVNTHKDICLDIKEIIDKYKIYPL